MLALQCALRGPQRGFLYCFGWTHFLLTQDIFLGGGNKSYFFFFF